MLQRTLAPWLTLVFCGLLVVPGFAESPPLEEGPNAELVAEGEALLTNLDEARERVAALRERASGAQGAARRIANEQMWQATREAARILQALAENLEAQNDAEVDTSATRERLQADVRTAWPNTLARLDDLMGRTDALSQKRDAAAPEERVKLEGDITEATRTTLGTYTLLVESLLALEGAGVELSEQREFLAKELTRNAELLSASATVAMRERDEVQAQLDLTPDDSSLQAELPAADRWSERATTNLAHVADLMDQLGLETETYRQVVFEATGEITADVLDSQVALGLLDRWRAQLTDSIVEFGPRWVLKAFVFVGILFAFRLLASATRRVVTRSLAPSRVKISQLLRDSLVSWSSRGVMLLGLLVALSQLGIEIGPMLAGLGIVGFILGFAMQDSLSNFAAGGMILIYRPFDVNDLIEAAGVRGNVQRMTLVSTTILTLDNQTLILPNSKIWGDVIRNVTAQTIRRVDLVFGISYESSVDQADAVLRGILKKDPRVLEEPESTVEVHTLNESSVDFVVRPWVKTEDYWDAYWAITREVKKRFDEEGISIPYPQRDVHVKVPAGGEA
jgi:small conductance mechanosensitive channel